MSYLIAVNAVSRDKRHSNCSEIGLQLRFWQLAFTDEPGGGTPTAGQAWLDQPQVTVEDGNGVPLTGDTSNIQLAIEPLTGTLGAALTCANNGLTTTAGVASFSGCSIDKAGTAYELVATDGTDLLSATSAPFDISAGAASQLVFTKQPTSSAGGQAFTGQPQVTVADAGGNTVTGNSDQVTLSLTGGASGASLTCAQPNNTVVANNGVATFSGCSVNDAGSGYQLTATDSASSLSANSNPFSISVGNAANIQFSTEPGGGSGGVAFNQQPVVSLTDSGGNPVGGTVKLSIEPGTGTAGATLSCALNPLGVNVSNGQAAFSGCDINEAGSGYVLVATVVTASGTLQASSNPFGVTGGSVAHASISTEPGAGTGSITGGTALPQQPAVTLTDSGGNPAAGSVTLSLAPGLGAPGAKLTCSQNPVVAQSGMADFSGCSVNQAGTGYELIATIGSVTAQSTSFNVGVGPPAQLAFTTQPSGGTGGTAWTGQPTVVVEDAGGNQVTTDTSSISLSVTSGTGNGPELYRQLTAGRPGNGELHRLQHRQDGIGVHPDGDRLGGRAHAGQHAVRGYLRRPGQAGLRRPAEWFDRRHRLARPAGSGGGRRRGQPCPDLYGHHRPIAHAGYGDLRVDPDLLAQLGGGLGRGGRVLWLLGQQCGRRLHADRHRRRRQVDRREPAVLRNARAPRFIGGGADAHPAGPDVRRAKLRRQPDRRHRRRKHGDGALTFSTSDLTVAGIGEPLDLVRTYNSDDTTGGSFGPGWTSILDLGVQIAANHATATVRGEDGQQIVFTWNTRTLTWAPPPGAKASLTCVLTVCTVVRFDGTSWTTISGKLVDYLAPDGQGLTFSYSTGLVRIIVDTTNKTPLVVNAHVNATGQVTQVTTPTRTVSYAYSGGLLTSFTDADGNTWTYSYSGGRLTTVTDPLNNVRLQVTFASSGRVATEQQEVAPSFRTARSPGTRRRRRRQRPYKRASTAP